ncbi:MFS transporter [Actinoplanes sp. NPDC049118]|uniref:MFS transporter n=1 Tax=Actinoplanes sp. NPDC049118 TaxID=3155769 RepID=UPI0033D56FBF
MASAPGGRLGGAFRLIWLGRSLSMLGGYVQFLALPLWIQQVTGSTVAALAAFGIFFLPQIFCTPFAGVLADRFDRRRLVIAVDLAAFAVAASLALTIDAHRLTSVYVHLAVLQALSALCIPAFLSMLPDLVAADRLLAANSLLNVSAGVAVTVGPLLGTALLAHTSITVVVWLNALTFLVAAACMMRRAPGAAPDGAGTRRRAGTPGPWTQLRHGLRALRADPVLRASVAAEAPWYLCFGAATQLVLMHLGAAGLAHAPGLFGLGAGLGSLLMTAVLARIRRDLSAAHLLMAAVLATAPVALVVAWLAGDGGTACAVLAGLLLGVQSYALGIGTTLHCQRRPAPDYRGRVTALRRTSNAVWQVAGIAAAAVVTQWVPALALVAFGGVLATVTAAPAAWRALRSSGVPVPEPATPAGAR